MYVSDLPRPQATIKGDECLAISSVHPKHRRRKDLIKEELLPYNKTCIIPWRNLVTMSSFNSEVGLLEICRGCTKELKPESLLRHVGKAKKCLAVYGSDYENLKKEKRLAQKRSYNSRNQLEIKEKQAKYNRSNSEAIKERQTIYNRTNSEAIKERQTKYNIANSKAIKEKQAYYNKVNRIWINYKKRKRDTMKKDAITKNDRFVSFKQEIKDGPSFVCFSCDRALFLRGVSILEDRDILKLKENPGEIFLTTKIFTSDVDYHNFQWTFCHSCLSYIRKGEVPKIHVSNGLQLDDIPDSLKLTELEQQLIAKDIVFMKIKKLPKSRMQAILDRVINVPIQDDDITKTVTSLPRPPH